MDAKYDCFLQLSLLQPLALLQCTLHHQSTLRPTLLDLFIGVLGK
jgi:hypothetical protein